MPAGDHRDREVEAHDGVHRDHQRRGEARQQQVGHLVVAPVPGRAAPAQATERRRCTCAHAAGGAVAQRGQIGNHAHVPEQRGHRGVGAHREHVPQQRAAEVRPHAQVRVRHREQPVRAPRPAHVEQREDAGAGDREQRHGFGEAVDGGPPALAQQKQDGRDQRAGVADADPENEVGDVPGPADRADCCPTRRCRCRPGSASIAPRISVNVPLIADGDVPGARRLPLDDAADRVGDVRQSCACPDQRRIQFGGCITDSP